jgi:hypothetical protein
MYKCKGCTNTDSFTIADQMVIDRTVIPIRIILVPVFQKDQLLLIK